jgi:hypothetical protein
MAPVGGSEESRAAGDQCPIIAAVALLSAIGSLSFTPLADGVAETMDIFRHALTEGRIKPE